MDKDTINELYSSLVLEHSRKPRNFGSLTCGCHKKGRNASCGDELMLHVHVNEQQLIQDIKFEGNGCALFMSSSSLMTQFVKNKPVAEVNNAIARFIEFVIKDDIELDEEFEPLHIFGNVKQFPARVKCLLLPWRTLEGSLQQDNNIITTE